MAMTITQDLRAESDYLDARFSAPGADVLAETREIYGRILDLANTSAHPFLVKCHNFVPQILVDRHYQAFNAGRRQAFEAAHYGLHPASCAVGSPEGRGLEITCLLGPAPPIELENPRQVSAYQYPEQFGPPPLFSRAVLDRGRLYVSGTASIVGFETLHPGDLLAQYEETMRNIAQITGPLGVAFADLSFVVYVNEQEHLALIEERFEEDAQYFVCDICRPDLVIEIEATSKHGKHITPVHP